MKCKVCGEELQKGYLPSIQGSYYWLPDGIRRPLTIFSHPKEGIRLSGLFESCVAFYCSNCETIIISKIEELQKKDSK